MNELIRMETTTSIKPKSLAELLPELSGIVSKDALHTLTARKQPRPTMALTRTAEKVMKPLTMAEMKSVIVALKVQSPRRAQTNASEKKRNWNSSVKVENKKISHTGNGQMKYNSARKVLNFQTKATPVPVSETPKFPKPEFRAKKSAVLQANNVRISGICKIPETPLIPKPVNHRITIANKENKLPFKPTHTKKPEISKPNNMPKLNESWKSSCDASFIQKEKEIQVEEMTKAMCEEKTLENIAEVSPPVSTPFREYRNVKEYFHNSNVLDSSPVANDTIMYFESENDKREESVIVSLCDMLNKAKVIKPENTSTELQNLLEVKKQTELNIEMIENGIQTLNNIKQSHLKSLEYVTRLLNEKQNDQTSSTSDVNKTLTELTNETAKLTLESNPASNLIVKSEQMKSHTKSPTYKIPKKNLCLKKKVFHKSMPNVSNFRSTPEKDINDKALSVYMKMKEHMNFLNTPVRTKHKSDVPDTPMITSHNLQKQLDKLYTEN